MCVCVCVCVCKIVIFSETTKGQALKDAERFALFCPLVIPLYICTLSICCFCSSVKKTAAKVTQSFGKAKEGEEKSVCISDLLRLNWHREGSRIKAVASWKGWCARLW